MSKTTPHDQLRRHLLVAAILAVGLYGLGFWWIEHRRVRHGPWEVEFRPDASAHRLQVTIVQPKLGLGPIELVIPWPPHESMPEAGFFRFDQARSVPFVVPGGRCVFQDLLFLPGTVVLELQGVLIEMLPRCLRVGDQEVPWEPPRRIEVEPTGKERFEGLGGS
jgi:hypothetical protein